MSSLLSKNCLVCNRPFSKGTNTSLKNWNTRSKYCSRECLNQSKIGKPTWIKGKFGILKANSGSFKKGHVSIVPLEKRARGSVNNKWKGGQIEKHCFICNKSFLVDRYRLKAKCCSIDCVILWKKTEEHRNHMSDVQRSKISERMKGFTETVCTFKSLLRRCSRYNMWREYILKRDDFTCQTCGVHGGKLCVDHIEPFITIIARNNVTSYEEAITCKELWEVDNGRTLCLTCHYKTPTFGSKVLKLLDNQLSS